MSVICIHVVMNVLKPDLDSGVLNGNFASSLSTNSGIDNLVAQGTYIYTCICIFICLIVL
jgi:hypothetical protein